MRSSITQQHELSCGLACVSFITGKPYDLLAMNERPKSLNHTGFSCIGLVRRLRQEEYHYGWKKISDTQPIAEFPIGAIVFVGRSSVLPHGHWLVLSKQGWMDPWINLREDTHIAHAQSGFRKLLPGRPEWVLLPQT